MQRDAGDGKAVCGEIGDGGVDLPAIDQHNVLRCHIFHPAVDKKTRGAFKSCIDLQFRMPMAFDNLASRPGVPDDEARDSSVYLHFFKNAVVRHGNQLLPVFVNYTGIRRMMQNAAESF